MLPGRWDTCQKEVTHEDDIPTGKVHRFQKPPQPNPNYMSEKWKLNLSKVHSVLFLSVLSILCSNAYWLRHLVMACGELFRVDIKQSGSWVVLWCICWTCVAEFSSRYVIVIVPFFLTSISSTRQHTCSCAALCEISRCYLSFLPTSTLHYSFGCVVYLFRQLGWNWASQSQMSYPWSIEGNHDLVLASAVLIAISPPPKSSLDRGFIVQ